MGSGQAWMFFDWAKNEILTAKGLTDKQSQKAGASFARYISYGRECSISPRLVSPNGYELIFPPGAKVLCCRISSYGSYLSVEGSEVIDYYFRVL